MTSDKEAAESQGPHIRYEMEGRQMKGFIRDVLLGLLIGLPATLAYIALGWFLYNHVFIVWRP